VRASWPARRCVDVDAGSEDDAEVDEAHDLAVDSPVDIDLRVWQQPAPDEEDEGGPRRESTRKTKKFEYDDEAEYEAGDEEEAKRATRKRATKKPSAKTKRNTKGTTGKRATKKPTPNRLQSSPRSSSRSISRPRTVRARGSCPPRRS
jgi:hypothetical protein